ncbi:uncharacterized protein [Phaenicophaeus curvirostris]|uniref:uncharacterized protein isoform X3 n=1 Tax=Phaenicophaeus curvirostris TaxID=33595 RepID=UPI0037F0AB82
MGDFNLPGICWKYNTGRGSSLGGSWSAWETTSSHGCRDNLTEVLAMREPLRDPDPSSGSGGKVMWRCPPGLQLSERYGAFPSLSYTRGGRRGGCPRVKWKRLPFSPKSQSRECPCCRKPGKSLAAQPRFLKAPYSSTFHPVVRSNDWADLILQANAEGSVCSQSGPRMGCKAEKTRARQAAS